MKAIILLVSLFFTLPAQSSTFITNWQGLSHPYLGSISCSSLPGGATQQLCVNIAGPIVFEGVNDFEVTPPDTDEYFWTAEDKVLREMSYYMSTTVTKDVSGTVYWDSFDTYEGSSMSIFGHTIDLLSQPSGSFHLSLFAGTTFDLNSVTVFADSLSSYGIWSFSSDPIPEVPLPASLFLFAPALLGFIGLRRKLS